MAGRKPANANLMPSIISSARSRVEKRVVMGAPSARELNDYVQWAADLLSMPKEEVMILTLDKALAEFFRRDGGWQAKREEDATTPKVPQKPVVPKGDIAPVTSVSERGPGSKPAPTGELAGQASPLKVNPAPAPAVGGVGS